MRISILFTISSLTIVFTLVTLGSFAQSATPFNHGRTRCYYGGLSFATDGKTIYHTHVHQKDTLSAITGKIAISTWRKNEWSEPEFPLFTNGNESYPVIDGNRLYFSSDAALPDRPDSRDQNIWYAEKTATGWDNPMPVAGLNSLQNDRLAFIDGDRNFYIINNFNNQYDIVVARQTANRWTDPAPMDAWNSPGDEEFVSVYPAVGVAFIQHSNAGNATEIMISKLENGKWSTPIAFNYDQKTTQLPYVQRWPQLSPDLSVFYMVNHGVIWQQPSKSVLEQNGITLKQKVSYKPLAARPLAFGEPELFGGMLLKTNNGISLTPDGKTIYLSRYTNERDSLGRRFIKIFSSELRRGNWTIPQPTTFNKPGVPFEYHPVLNVDGKKLFFNSRAPIPGSGKKFESKNNIWWVDRQGDGWSEPHVVQSLVTDNYDDYSTPTKDGTLYFRSDRPGGLGGGDIYMSKYVNGEYLSPENLRAINSSFNENDLCVDPQGRFIIFNRSFEWGQTTNLKLYLTVRTKMGWTKPRELKQLEKSYDYELTPTLAGKYFYYEVNSNIVRVETRSLFLPEEWTLMEGRG